MLTCGSRELLQRAKQAEKKQQRAFCIFVFLNQTTADPEK